MTAKNLNGTIVDRIVAEYRRDRAMASPHPVKYFLADPKLGGKNLCWVIRRPMAPRQVRRQLATYRKNRGDQINFENKFIRVWVCSRLEKKRVEKMERKAAEAAKLSTEGYNAITEEKPLVIG